MTIAVDNLRAYVLAQIEIFHGVTDKFRIMAGGEGEAAQMVADIEALNLLDGGAFDIERKKYADGWCVRVSWEKLQHTKTHLRFRGDEAEAHGCVRGHHFAYRLPAGPSGFNVSVHDDVAAVFRKVGQAAIAAHVK